MPHSGDTVNKILTLLSRMSQASWESRHVKREEKSESALVCLTGMDNGQGLQEEKEAVSVDSQ